MDVASDDDELGAELAAMRPEQSDVFARSLHAEIRRNLVGVTEEPFRLGRFTVLESLGGGGMGVVFVAYDPILDRKIALKVLRSSGERGRREVLREGRALARLKHPNVVTVYEVVEVDDRVCVAMEYVEGRSLREWLRKPRPIDAILARLIEAGRGLAAAHAVDLVHRDFKPENVVIDAHGHARVIDFGLARASEELRGPGPIVAGAPMTGNSVHGGTPAYMAPERLAGGAGDHRSDQYSLCVTCWEALFGVRPADARAGSAEVPHGRSVPGWLRKVLARGLSVAPADRYPSTEALLAALRADPTRRRRALAGVAGAGLAVAGWFGVQDYREAQQVAACTAEGASMEEVWNEEAQRKLRASLLATGVAYAGTTADTVVPYLAAQAEALGQARTQACLNVRVRATWDEVTAARSLWCLDERQMELEALVGELSRAESAPVQAAVEAATGLSQVGPCQDVARLARLPPLPQDREGVRAVLRMSAQVGALRLAGRYEEGLREAQAALAAAEALSWPPLTAATRENYGYLLHLTGKYPEAEAALEDAYFEATLAGASEVAATAAVNLVQIVGYQQARHADGIRWSRHVDTALSVLAGEDEASLRRGAALNVLAQVHEATGDYAQAQVLHERALAILERALGPDHPRVATSLNNLANVHFATRALAEAKPLQERALVIQERALGTDHPYVATSLNNLANVHLAMASYDEAKVLLERAVAIDEQTLGPEHPDLANALNGLAGVYRMKGDYSQARALQQRALAIREQALGPDHPDVANSLHNLAGVLALTGAYGEAERLIERALTIREKALGPDHPDLAKSLDSLAGIHMRLGAYAEARALYERELAIQERVFGPEHVGVALALGHLALLHVAMGEPAAARPLADRALAIREQKQGPDHPDVAASLSNVARVRLATGAYEEAEALYRRALAIDEKQGSEAPEVAYSLLGLAKVALARGRPADAVPLADRAVAILAGRQVAAHKLALGRLALAQALWAAPAGQGRDHDRALAQARSAREELRATKGEHKELAEVEAFLAKHGDSR